MMYEKTCYNCGNLNCNQYYAIVKKDVQRHFEVTEYRSFVCVNHNRWQPFLKLPEEIRV